LDVLFFLSFLVGVLSSLIFVFSNTLSYVLILLCLVRALIALLVSCNALRGLVGLIVCIVYVGAMMILIGYICAVSPNLITASSRVTTLFLVTAAIVLFLGLPSPLLYSPSSVLSYFYGVGAQLFVIIAFMLFFTLLIVSCQYSHPQSPFRSLN
jgi:hypothetical protein